MDSWLGSVNTLAGLIITLAGGCIWLGNIYASHKTLQKDVAELSDRFRRLDRKIDHVLNILIAKHGTHLPDIEN
jgi:hypothetical protein